MSRKNQPPKSERAGIGVKDRNDTPQPEELSVAGIVSFFATLVLAIVAFYCVFYSITQQGENFWWAIAF